MSQDQPFMWYSSLGGVESLGISKTGPTVVGRLMESQMELTGFVGGGFTKGTMASDHLDDKHFVFSLCTTGVFLTVIPVLELRGSESE